MNGILMFSHWEMMIVLVVVLIVFGAGKLPKVLGQLGEGVKNFKDSAAGEDENSDSEKPE